MRHLRIVVAMALAAAGCTARSPRPSPDLTVEADAGGGGGTEVDAGSGSDPCTDVECIESLPAFLANASTVALQCPRAPRPLCASTILTPPCHPANSRAATDLCTCPSSWAPTTRGASGASSGRR